MISFDINNGMALEFEQERHDGTVIVTKRTADGSIVERNIIPAGQFVMLNNLYRYIIENDYQNDFLNPFGKNKEV